MPYPRPRGIGMSNSLRANTGHVLGTVLLAGTSALVLTVLGGLLPSPSFATDTPAKPSAGTADEICRTYGADSQECIAALAALTPGIGARTTSNDRPQDGGAGDSSGASSGGSSSGSSSGSSGSSSGGSSGGPSGGSSG